MESNTIYEIGFHILPTVPEEKLGDAVQALRKVIDEGKGEIIAEGYPQRIDLAYPMQKYIDTKKVSFDRAYFGWIKFEGDGSLAQAIEEAARGSESVLRSLVVKTVRENTVMEAPDEREEAEEKEDAKPEATKKAEPKEESKKEEVSEEEIDKSIDELVIE